MIPFHTVYVVTLISQATSALILIILAANERRLRGMNALAGACTLHTISIALMPLWRGADRWVLEAIAAALLPIIFSLIYIGLRDLVRPGSSRQKSLPFLVAPVIAFVVLVAPWSQLVSMQVARASAIALILASCTMLWRTRMAFVRPAARVTAALLLTVALTLAARMPLESSGPASNFLLSLRELTIAEITVLAFSFLGLYLAETKRRVHFETRMDALTGRPNRRAMEEQASTQVHAALRTGRPLCLLMMDLDAFKLLNDTWGHAVGDRALRAVGKVLQSASVNGNTIVARLSGEEFAMLLPEHTVDAAQSTAELLRTAIATTHVVEGIRHVTFTVSIGVAAWHSGEKHWSEMFHRADMALYRAKREGRNRVVLCEQLIGEPVSTDRHSRRFRDAPHSSSAEHV